MNKKTCGFFYLLQWMTYWWSFQVPPCSSSDKIQHHQPSEVHIEAPTSWDQALFSEALGPNVRLLFVESFVNPPCPTHTQGLKNSPPGGEEDGKRLDIDISDRQVKYHTNHGPRNCDSGWEGGGHTVGFANGGKRGWLRSKCPGLHPEI